MATLGFTTALRYNWPGNATWYLHNTVHAQAPDNTIPNNCLQVMDPGEALFEAIRGNRLASVQGRIQADRSLLNAVFTPHNGGLRNYSTLEWAAWCNHLQILRFLISEGADLNCGYGSPVLSWACLNGRLAIVELLLEAGADAVTPNEIGSTPLMWAAYMGHVAIVRALLAHGCGDIDAVCGSDGTAALRQACGGGHADAAQLLLEAGADVRVPDRWGRTLVRRAHLLCDACEEVVKVGGCDSLVRACVKDGR
jgi:ankyrin repeat protein